MMKKISTACALSLLAACGGGATAIVPLSEDGFADATRPLGGPYDFTIPGLTRIASDAEGSLSFSEENIRVTGTSGAGPVRVEVAGRSFLLERDPSNSGRLSFVEGDDRIELLDALKNNNFAFGAQVYSVLDDQLNTGLFIAGYDTDPDTVAQQTQTANYAGGLRAELRNNTSDSMLDGYGTGEFVMTVDFGDMTVGGTGDLRDLEASVAEITFDPVTLNFETARIRGNSYEGQMTVVGDLSGTLLEARYNGRLFGPEAETIGGQFIGRIDIDTLNTDTFISGIFLGNLDGM